MFGVLDEKVVRWSRWTLELLLVPGAWGAGGWEWGPGETLLAPCDGREQWGWQSAMRRWSMRQTWYDLLLPM